MGTETYSKNGQVSKKEHGGKGQGSREVYKESPYDPIGTFGDGPDAFDRKYSNKYRKASLPSSE